MRTKDELFRAAQREVAAYRQQAVMQAETARRAAYAAHPALAEADAAHMRAGLGLAKAAALGSNMDTARAALARADEALAAAVREAGFSADDFKPAYRCPLCEDTGMRGGVPCRCVADAARRLRRDEINAASPLGLCQFASFEVERYSDAVEPELGISPREYMGKLLNYCRGYAAKFSQNSPNLLFMGHTGLGKTHLALAIADAVLEGGHDVLYTSAAALAAQLKDHSLARTYVCIVCGKIKDDSGTIDAPIGRHPADRKKMAVTEKNSRSAVTHWRVLERFSGYTLVECKLETGRTHQIRVHMAYRGHPILGDMVYGHKKPELGQDSQCLHAKELRFVHPRTGQLVTVSCELPDYFTALLEKLRARA